jgi:hypothetical protein
MLGGHRDRFVVFDGGAVTSTSFGPAHLLRTAFRDGPMTRSDKVATLEEAKARFQKSWDAWKAWARLEEVE